MAVLNDNHKSCPFCGGSGNMKHSFRAMSVFTYIDSFYIECQNCACKTAEFASPAHAWAAWDRRAGQKNKAGGAGTPEALGAN